MRTELARAFFDVRDYNAKLQRDQRRVKADNETIAVSISYPSGKVPEQYIINGQIDDLACRVYTSKGAAERGTQNDKVSIKFKLGSMCRWFDKHGQPCQRPTNAELEDKQYDVVIDYNRKEKNPANNLAPSGYWVNAIMFAERADNPFVGCEIEPIQVQAAAEQVGSDAEAAYEEAAVVAEMGDSEGLPF